MMYMFIYTFAFIGNFIGNEVGHQDRVIFAPQDYFVGYHVNFLLYRKKDAMDMWLKASAKDSGVAKQTDKHGRLCCAIELPSMAVDEKKNVKRKGFRKETTADSDADPDEFEQDAKKKVRC